MTSATLRNINKGRYGGQADEARDILFSSTGRTRNHGSCAMKLRPVCAPPMGGLKSKPRFLPTFFTWLSNNSIHPIYMTDQWQFNTYIVTAIQYIMYYMLNLHLFLGDWLQLTALLLRALLPVIFQTEKVLDQVFCFCLMIQFFLLNS